MPEYSTRRRGGGEGWGCNYLQKACQASEVHLLLVFPPVPPAPGKGGTGRLLQVRPCGF